MSDNTLCFTGMSREDEAAALVAFEQANAFLAKRFVITSEAEAQVIVIDMDSIYGHMTWLKQHASGKTLVALTSGERAETELLLARPLTVASLTDLLAKISGQTASTVAIARTTGQQPAMPAATARSTGQQAAMPAASVRTTGQQPAMPAATIRSTGQQPAMPAATIRSTGQQTVMPAATIRSTGQQPAMPPLVSEAARVTAPQTALPAEPAKPPRDPRLSDYLAPGALTWPVMLQLAGAPMLVLDPNSQTYVGSATLKPLLPYVQAIIRPEDLVPVDVAELVQLRAGHGGPQPFQRLAWLLGYAGGNGALLPGFDINAKYQMSKWPQTEREFPKHFRIATVMMKGPATLIEIADQSGATLAEVTDFVNANLVTGMAIPEGGTPVADLARASSLLGARA